MKHLAVMLITLSVLLGCVTDASQVEGPQADILILSHQGVDPAIDSVGFNILVKNVTQSFAEALSIAFQERSASFISVLDQNPTYEIGKKLAIYSAKHSSKVAIVLTLETEKIGSGVQMRLRAQYIEQEFIVTGGKVRGVKPSSSLDKTYLLRSSFTGDNPETMSGLARNYVDFLKEQGRM